MESILLIKKIRKYGIISFLVPLITINACFLIFDFLGSITLWPDLNWSEKKIELPLDEYTRKQSNTTIKESDLLQNFLSQYLILISDLNRGALNCPKYELDEVYITHDNQKIRHPYRHVYRVDSDSWDKFYLLKKNFLENNKIKTILLEQNEVINNECIKNHKIKYKLINNFNFLHKIIVKGIINNSSGFSKIKNPYIYGEASISRTARYYPSIIIFKFFIILSSVFLFLYWKNTLNLFNNFENKNVLNNFSKKFFYFGILSCIFLILHASLLGLDIDSKFFQKIRRLIIILFIIFEITAQIFLTINILKFKNKIKKYIHPLVLYLKVIFVSVIFLTTLISFGILAAGDPSSEFKHILEWNYFSFLLLYYLLSTQLWKTKNFVV